MIEKRIVIDKVNPLLLFGQNDAHLQKIEATFPETRIIARGNALLLQGDEADIKQIENIIHEFSLAINRNGYLSRNDIDTIINLVHSNSNLVRSNGDDVILYTPHGNVIKPKTSGQKRLVEATHHNDIVFAIGPAGTGKTYLAVALAVAAFKAKLVKRIVLSRPAVEAGESLGFLPGDFRDKIDPYLRPLYDALEDMIPREKLTTYLQQNQIEIVPLAYMRGRTLHSAFVILDEAQNATTTQMKMFLTRLGANSRGIVTGDVTQTDLPRRSQSGLVQVQRILHDVDGISFVKLDKTDVVRHQLVQDIIEAYDKFEAKENES